MKANKVIARMPYNWNDFGTAALSEAGEEMYISLISKRLPDEIDWCGDELLGPVDLEWDINELGDIISAAYEEMCSCYGGEQYWMGDEE